MKFAGWGPPQFVQVGGDPGGLGQSLVACRLSHFTHFGDFPQKAEE